MGNEVVRVYVLLINNTYIHFFFTLLVLYNTCNIKHSSKITKCTLLLLLVWDETSGEDGYSIGSN